ncbi:MAG: radical SAM family heme chaperone HemW [Candidatus Margulisiibacteriota bacterium]|jgi:oxygen-independent coproporphyrinogen-3 oxidase
MAAPSLYIHLPFCKKKCNYCDFVSYAGKEELIDEYVETLIQEIKLQLPTLDAPLSTIFFGGGTPTLLEPKHYEKILTTLSWKPATMSSRLPEIEITIEANPGTADLNKLKELRSLGINRLSIGIQSFHDHHLQTLGRIHSSSQALHFYEDARAVGFENISLDLIFALPDQSFEEWKKDLQQAIALNPEHLSAYSLQIEEGTPFWEMTNDKLKMKNEGKALNLPTEEVALAMYEYTIEALWLTGYKHYEISNFAKAGKECRHNLHYWQMGNWLGVGAGAHSHVDGKLWANVDSIEEYLIRKPATVSSRFPDEARRNELLFMGLRLLDGLPTEKFHGFEKEVAELIADGLLKEENGNYKLTKQGLYLGNLVFEKFV